MDPLVELPADTLARILALYPALRGVRADLRALIPHAGAVPADTVLFDEGEPCKGFPLLLGHGPELAVTHQDLTAAHPHPRRRGAAMDPSPT